jgi:ATP-binding cassette subfamily F protein uup
MNYLSVENISKRFGERLLFSEVSFGLDQGQKMALVAKNGEGKTTLLSLLQDKESPDSGQINWRKGLKIAFLDQNPHFDDKTNVKEFLFSGGNEQIKAIERYREAILDPENIDDLQAATEMMDAQNAWDYDAKLNKLLTVFEMDELPMDQKVSLCSGGQKKRLALIKLIVDEPDVLLLDEPTNHLDIYMIEWLEEYLSQDSITLFMITHDRYFLNNTCDQILELDHGKAYRYQGNYEYFLEKKAEREQIEQNSREKKQNLYRREIEWMRRMPKARGTKSKSRQDQFYGLQDDLKSGKREQEMEMNIKAERMGSKIIELHHVKKSFGELKILDDFSYVFKNRERIGIAGKNGSGKTTFLKMIMGKEAIDGGKIVQGETVKFGYYSQSGIDIKDGKRVIEVIKDIAEFIPMEKGKKLTARQLLERFLFRSDQHYTYVSKLSGGEKKRLYLLTVLMSNPNFLILDEPTNDLDIKTIRILEEFLLDFPGCLMVVSHDRAFMDRLSDHIFYFEGDGKIRDFPGNYSQLLTDLKKRQQAAQQTASQKKNQAERAAQEKSSNFTDRLAYMERREFNRLEKEIAKLETKKAELSDLLSRGELENQKLLEVSEELGKLIEEIDEKTDRWMELAERA